MKTKYLSILIIFFICSSFQVQQKKLETGWYFISDNKQSGITFEDLDSHQNYSVEKLPFITVSDIKGVKLADENMSGFKIKKLKLKLTHEGNKKWDLATEEMSHSNKSAVFVFENVVFCQLRLIGKARYVSPSIVDNDLNSLKLKSIYDSMPENIKK